MTTMNKKPTAHTTTFTLNGTDYAMNSKTGYAVKYEGGKGIRIKAAEFEEAHTQYVEQQESAAAESEETEEEKEIVKRMNDEQNRKNEFTNISPDAVKKAAKKAVQKKSPVKVGGMEFSENGVHVVITARQVEFLRHLPDTGFWENGLDSCLWVDILCDEIEGSFEGKPMSVGAMVSTLREKGLLRTGRGKVERRMAKFFELTETGKKVAAQLGVR